jgi:hypothetical protein
MAEWKFHKKRALGLVLALGAVVVGVFAYWYFEKPVDIAALDRAFAQADRLVIVDRSTYEEKVIYESKERKDIDQLSLALKVVEPDEWFSCLCLLEEVTRLYQGEKLVAEVYIHHGESLGCNLWSGQACLENTEAMLSWFDARGMPGHRREVDESRRSNEQRSKDWERWVSAVPKGLEKLWNSDLDIVGRPKSLDSRMTALEVSFPKVGERILALYAWHGSGAGPWSGFPGYEVVSEELLLTYSTGELVEAAQSPGMATPAHWEGAARLFGGWSFSKNRPGDLAQVPASLKESFWNHVKDTKDQDKLGRAQVAFAPKDASKK